MVSHELVDGRVLLQVRIYLRALGISAPNNSLNGLVPVSYGQADAIGCVALGRALK